jgi:hypothetical protein
MFQTSNQQDQQALEEEVNMTLLELQEEIILIFTIFLLNLTLKNQTLLLILSVFQEITTRKFTMRQIEILTKVFLVQVNITT